jgi:hypothetical protein
MNKKSENCALNIEPAAALEQQRVTQQHVHSFTLFLYAALAIYNARIRENTAFFCDNKI